MQLWTIQPMDWYEKLLKDGIIYGDKQYIEDEFPIQYQWMIQQMEEKIGKRPFSDSYPIWAWYHYLNMAKKKPDLRCAGHLPKGSKGVRIEIFKHENEVLLSDFNLWHLPLNYAIITDTEEDDKEFDKLLEINNVKYTDKDNYTKEIKQKVEESWVKVLDMNYAPEYGALPFEKKSIQATFWSLSVDEIIKVDEFTAR